MACVDCHDADEMHGVPSRCDACHFGGEQATGVPPAQHRYDGLQLPSCEACHAAAASGLDGIPMHAEHGGDLSCQVCHSLPYSNCDGCHVAISETSGNPYFSTEAFYLGFFIGRNPRPSYARPYDFVPVRHVPIAAGNFDYYGKGLLPSFDSLPTWVYTTPHNTQRITPQAELCNACHGNPEWFLTADKVSPTEWRANRQVVLPSIPAPVRTEEVASP